MSFLRRLKERRVKASQNVTPTPALPESEPAWGDEGRKGPLADFVAQSQNERTEGSVDLGQANINNISISISWARLTARGVRASRGVDFQRRSG